MTRIPCHACVLSLNPRLLFSTWKWHQLTCDILFTFIIYTVLFTFLLDFGFFPERHSLSLSVFQFASAPHMCTWDPLARRAHSGPAQAGEQGQGKNACVCLWADHLPSAGPCLPSVSPCPPLENKDIESVSCCAVRRQWPPSAAVSVGVKRPRTPEIPLLQPFDFAGPLSSARGSHGNT